MLSFAQVIKLLICGNKDIALSVSEYSTLGLSLIHIYRFLIEELRLEVENKVPANGTNFLVGQSYAGLFTLQTLSNHPEAFDSYIAIDPSLWWDRGVFLQQAAKNVYQKVCTVEMCIRDRASTVQPHR